MHWPDTREKGDKTIKRDYGGQSWKLEEGPSEVACHQDGFASLAVAVPSIIEWDIESVSEKEFQALWIILQTFYRQWQIKKTGGLHCRW